MPSQTNDESADKGTVADPSHVDAFSESELLRLDNDPDAVLKSETKINPGTEEEATFRYGAQFDKKAPKTHDTSVPFKRDYIRFRQKSEGESPLKQYARSARALGVKVHVSIDDSKDDDNFAQGRQIVIDILCRNQVREFKTVSESYRREMANGVQDGKQITFYPFKQSWFKKSVFDEKQTKDWNRIFEEITRELAAAGIRPGVFPIGSEDRKGEFSLQGRSGDRVLEEQGSNYISLRNDDPNFDMEQIHLCCNIPLEDQPPRPPPKEPDQGLATSMGQIV